MTDETKNSPLDSSETDASDGGDKSRSAETAPSERDEKAAGSPEAAKGAGELPAPDGPAPTPESQAALTGKAPSGSSASGTTVPASSTGAEQISAAPPTKPKPAAALSNETPEEKKARLEKIIAEAKAKKEAAAAQAEGVEGASPSATVPGGKSPDVGDPAKSPSQADLERAAKIAEAKARAAALKESAASKAPAASPVAPKSPATPAGASSAGAPKAPVKKKDEGPKPVDASDHPIVKRLSQRLGDEAVKGASTFIGQLSIHIKSDSIVAACLALRDDAETPFNYLSDLTCVHWPERDEAPFEIVYNLFSIPRNERVRLKSDASESEGIESVTSVWPTANWMEREVYDLFGVVFKNHPDMRRLLLPEDWDGHPLRKDFPLEFMENRWTTKHLPEFTDVQREQLEQRRAYGLEILQTPDERRIRELFRDSRDPLPKEHK